MPRFAQAARRLVRVFPLALAACVSMLAAPANAQARAALADPLDVMRVFLKNGHALASYGDFTCIGDRLVFTMPIGGGTPGTYPLVSVPLDTVDVARTERYAESVRAARFEASGGVAAYDLLVASVAHTVDAIAAASTPHDRLALAHDARDRLLDWLNKSHGYKSEEVAQYLSMLDDVIGELRAGAGESQFSFSLMAEPAYQAPEALAPALSPADSIALALDSAAVVEAGPERIAVLRAAVEAVGALERSTPGAADPMLAARARRELAEELATEHAYAALVADTTAASARAVRSGDVRAIVALRQRVIVRDAELGAQRPSQVTSLLSRLDAALDRAQAERLAIDHWEAVRPSLEAYRRRVAGRLGDLDAIAPLLGRISDMAGTRTAELASAASRLGAAVRALQGLTPPADLATVHALLVATCQMAAQAVAVRQRAVLSGDMTLARDASSAAAGAMLSADEARRQLALTLRAPQDR